MYETSHRLAFEEAIVEAVCIYGAASREDLLRMYAAVRTSRA